MPLNFAQVFGRQRASLQRLGQNVGGDDRVLNRVVDADAADRRHDVRGVADEEESRFVPLLHAARLDREHRDLLPVFQLLEASGELREYAVERLAQRFEAGGANLLVAALEYDVGDLPLTPAVEHDEAVAASEVRDAAFGVALVARDAEPEYVHRRRCLQQFRAAAAGRAGPSLPRGRSRHRLRSARRETADLFE